MLGDPKSFTNFDLGPLLDEYSTTLQQIRTLYEDRVHQKASTDSGTTKPPVGSSTIPGLQFAVDSGSKSEFDTAIATIALGEHGTFASYLVHPESVVELQVMLLQHARYLHSRSRSNSLTSPISSSPANDTFSQAPGDGADYFALEADDAERFAAEQNALTIDERERCRGSTPQKARLCVRWNADEDAQLAFRLPNDKCQHAAVKRKAVPSIFARSGTFSPQKAAATPESEQLLAVIHRGVQQDRSLRLLNMFSSCRTRFVGNSNNERRLVLATLDTHITIQGAENGRMKEKKSSFPYALLLVRHEGAEENGLTTALDQSHLVERVRGFSMEYHALWLTAQSSTIPAPYWLPMLERDIRKLPPPTLKRTSSTAVQTPASVDSGNGVTDDTTAVETARSNSVTPLDAPPLRSFRKKRRRSYKPAASPQESRYWSEYDHPEDEDGDANAYTIYIDPNEKSSFDAFFERLGQMFRRNRTGEEEPLLDTGDSTPKDDETSDEEDGAAARPRQKSYGALTRTTSRMVSQTSRARTLHDLEDQTSSNVTSMTHVRTICYVASLVVLLVAFILASTGKNKLRYEVDFGVIFAVSSSLFFAIVGFASLLREHGVSYTAWAIGTLVLVMDAIGSGGLLAWVLG